MKKEEKEKVVPENLQKTLGSLAETRDNALWFNRKGGSTMMEAIWIILPVGYILGMIALAVFFGGGHGNRTIANGRRDDDNVVGIFDDITDSAKSYLICNIHHDDSIGDDSSFDWSDSSLGDDMSSSSMWDD